MRHCTCKYCRSSKFNALRRRNPDDLETLEKIAEARRLYQQGVNRYQIGKKLRVDRLTLNKWLEDLMPEKPDVDLRRQQARELYQQGASKNQIMKQFRVGDSLLNIWLEDLIPEKPDVDPRRHQARELYQQGMSKNQIIKQFRVSGPLLNIWLADLPYKKRLLRRRNPDDLERLEKIVEAIELYKIHKSIPKVAQILGAGQTTIHRWIKHLIIPYSEELKRKVCEEYNKKQLDVKTIAKKYGIGRNIIYAWCKKRRSKKKIFFTEKQKEEIKKLYSERVPVKEIAAHYGVGPSRISRVVSSVARIRRQKTASHELKKLACELYDAGELTLKEIGKQLGVAESTIAGWCKKKGTAIRKPRERDVSRPHLYLSTYMRFLR